MSETDNAARSFPHRASYSPQDDKLRLFFSYRIPRDEWDKLRAQGWTWTMKQNSDMVAPWTPEREDAALSLAGDIEDEDEPREDRSADRAERFTGYMERREDEAEELADRYDAGPRVHAAQDAGRAERAAARHDRLGTRAVSKWETAEYWSQRTRGVIAHALYLERADVRHRRIKGIEAEIRGMEDRVEKARNIRAAWSAVAAMTDPAAQDIAARRIAGSVVEFGDYAHPRNPARRTASLYDLTREDQPDEDRISGAEAAALYLARNPEEGRTGYVARWLAHLRLRLAYEVQMLEAQGGTLADAEDIIPGGFVGRWQVVKVSKDRAGRVSRLYFLAPSTVCADKSGKPYGDDNPAPMSIHEIRAEKLTPGSYRPPTAAELDEFKAAEKARSKSKPKPPPLMNPDDASAERLQALWNDWASAGYIRSAVKQYGPKGAEYVKDFQPSAILPTTQAIYTAASAGAYARAETVDIRADGSMRRKSNMWSGEESGRDKAFPVVCRVRVAFCGNTTGPRRVVVLTDKKRDALPEFVPTARFDSHGNRIAEWVA